jgi:hypothetical protein
MDRYTELLNSITTGNHTQFANNNLTPEQAHELLKKTAERLKLVNTNPERTDIEDISFQGTKYYAYVALFPRPHVGIDNASGTDRVYSITTVEELNKIPVF